MREIDAAALCERYAQELAQERHKRICAEQALADAETEIEDLKDQLTDQSVTEPSEAA